MRCRTDFPSLQTTVTNPKHQTFGKAHASSFGGEPEDTAMTGNSIYPSPREHSRLGYLKTLLFGAKKAVGQGLELYVPLAH